MLWTRLCQNAGGGTDEAGGHLEHDVEMGKMHAALMWLWKAEWQKSTMNSGWWLTERKWLGQSDGHKIKFDNTHCKSWLICKYKEKIFNLRRSRLQSSEIACQCSKLLKVGKVSWNKKQYLDFREVRNILKEVLKHSFQVHHRSKVLEHLNFSSYLLQYKLFKSSE